MAAVDSETINETALPNAMSKRCSEPFNRVRNHLGASVLPEALQHAVDALLRGYPRRQLRASVTALSEAFLPMTQVSAKSLLQPKVHSEAVIQYSAPTIEYGVDEVYAYVASQMPFVLAPLQRIFGELKRRRLEFLPESQLDFGCGPGTALFAAQAQWPSLKQFMAIDTAQPMLDVAKELATQVGLEGVNWKRFMSVAEGRPRYDLVTCAHTLAELGDDGLRSQAVEHLWSQTGRFLVLVERGNAEGFRLIRNARQLLLEKFAGELQIVAPCSHQLECPMRGSWCHFAQRVQLAPLQSELFNLPKGFEDQKFSYLVLERTGAAQGAPLPRLVRPPLKRSGHVIQDACMPEGVIQRFVVAKSAGAQVFYDARKSHWGDSWPHPIGTKKRVMEDMSKKPKDYQRRKRLDLQKDGKMRFNRK